MTGHGETLRIGSFFSGYGGLDMAVQEVFGGDVVWYSEIDKNACQVLAAHHPGVMNLGDISTVDWSTVPPVDILTGGYPCQPFSQAGQRKGTDDERHLWPYVRDAISALRPMVTILENVDGHRSLGFDTVLGDIAEMGMSARWGVVRAADAGAPHGRKRVFIVVADPADAARRLGRTGQGWGLPQSERAAGLAAHVGRAASDSDCSNVGCGRGRKLEDAHAAIVGERDISSDVLAGSGYANDEDEIGDDSGSAVREGGVSREPRGDAGVAVDWGRYGPAIRRWERLTRPAPAPTIPGRNNRPRLSPFFVEWMMGLPAGHVTGHGLKPAAEIKMLGNGVCPQQAVLALRMLGYGEETQ